MKNQSTWAKIFALSVIAAFLSGALFTLVLHLIRAVSV